MISLQSLRPTGSGYCHSYDTPWMISLQSLRPLSQVAVTKTTLLGWYHSSRYAPLSGCCHQDDTPWVISLQSLHPTGSGYNHSNDTTLVVSFQSLRPTESGYCHSHDTSITPYWVKLVSSYYIPLVKSLQSLRPAWVRWLLFTRHGLGEVTPVGTFCCAKIPSVALVAPSAG